MEGIGTVLLQASVFAAPLLALAAAILVGKQQESSRLAIAGGALAAVLAVTAILFMITAIEYRDDRTMAGLVPGFLYLATNAATLAVAAFGLVVAVIRKWRRVGLLSGLALAFLIVPPLIIDTFLREHGPDPDKVDFTLYEPSHSPSGFALESTTFDTVFADNGFHWHPEGAVRFVEQRYVRSGGPESVEGSEYLVRQFTAEYVRLRESGCPYEYPYAGGESVREETNPDRFVCRKAGTMPTGETIYLEDRKTVTVSSAVVGDTAIVVTYSPGKRPGSAADPLAFIESMRKTDKNKRQEFSKER
ncbi:MAG: hypothetical protein WD846_02415 [Patescibacteria group bacterium]